MLMVRPPEVPPRSRRLPRGLRRFDWPTLLHQWCAGFHLFFGFTLAFAPFSQINTTASAPVLAMGSRYLWAALMLAAGVVTLRASRDLRPSGRLLAAALLVFPVGAIWLTAFIIAVLHGQGSALSVVIWPFLYGPWCVAMLRVGLGKR